MIALYLVIIHSKCLSIRLYTGIPDLGVGKTIFRYLLAWGPIRPVALILNMIKLSIIGGVTSI